MKVLIFLVICCFSYGYSQTMTWDDYKTEFGKEYSTQENNKRKNYFDMQTQRIQAHHKEFDAGRKSFDVDYNALTDTGFAYEYNTCFSAITWPADFPKGTSIEVDTSNLPETFELESSKVTIFDHSE